jgi:hypothetical protein
MLKAFGIWDSKIGICLEIGIWNLISGIAAPRQVGARSHRDGGSTE